MTPMETIEQSRLRQKIEWAQGKEAKSRTSLHAILTSAYRLRPFRRIAWQLINRLEGGSFFSQTTREILRTVHGVSVGRYSYGPCLQPGVLPPGTVVGNYCSIAAGLTVFRRNHPADTLSQHPFFFNRESGILEKDNVGEVAENPLTIEDDVWIGAHVIVLPRCRRIGVGAIVGAGSVVTKDVPPFTIVGGNPARRLGERFAPDTVARIMETKWWLRPLPELLEHLPLFLRPATELPPEVLRRIAGFAAPDSAGAPAQPEVAGFHR